LAPARWARWLVFGGYSGYPHERYERDSGRMVFRLSVGFLVAVLALLAMSLYLSEYYLGEERRLIAAGDLRGGLEAAQKAGRLDPFDPEPLEEVSFIRQQQGRNEEAVGALREAADRAPNDYIIYLELASLQFALGDLTGAEKNYHKVLELNPKAYAARSGLAALLLERGDLEGAKREYEKVEAAGEISYTDLYDLGRIYVRTGEPKEGYKAIKRARRQASEDAETLEGASKAQRQRLVESMDLALADALVVQGSYGRAAKVISDSSSEQAPGLLWLLETDPEVYREQVVNSDIQ
jgi:tetratricopeptide (TPR) repeat protein